MRSLFLAALFVATVPLQSQSAMAQPTVIVVRHGQKLDNSPDPVLSPQGEAQAARLANMLAATGITAIYTTQFKRTIMLAAPTAKRLGITPVSVPAKETESLLARIRTHGKGEVVLVVGHSNTVPAILTGLGHAALVTVAEEEFDNLFIVAMQASGPPAVVRLKY